MDKRFPSLRQAMLFYHERIAAGYMALFPVWHQNQMSWVVEETGERWRD